MEFTEIKNGMFGYKKVDVVTYISELNEIHTVQLQNKTDELQQLKITSESEIAQLKANNEDLALKVQQLKEQLSSVSAELNDAVASFDALKSEHNALLEQTADLRDKSDFIATAIIKAEKCAGLLVNEARANAQDMVDKATQKVESEKQRLETAKGYVSDIREQFNRLALQINEVLASSESEMNIKINAINKVNN